LIYNQENCIQKENQKIIFKSTKGDEMEKLTIASYLMFIISVLGIFYALIYNPASWIVYGISIVLIPLFILSLGLITMARSKKDEQDERTNEPFIGY